jgi:hypothetical protein
VKAWPLRQVGERTLRRDGLRDDVEAIDSRAARLGADQAGQQFHRRALTRAVRSNHERHFAGPGVHRNTTQDWLAPVILRQVFGQDHFS